MITISSSIVLSTPQEEISIVDGGWKILKYKLDVGMVVEIEMLI